MEQKKTLWIIAAVGAFLLVVLGYAGLQLRSISKNINTTITSTVPAENNLNNGWNNSSAETNKTDNQPVALPADTNTKVNEMIVFADKATVYETVKKDSENATTIDLNDLKYNTVTDNLSPAQPQQPQNQNINITVNIPETATSKIETTTSEITKPVYQEPVKVENKVKPAQTEKTNVTVKKPADTKAKTVKTAATPAPKAEPKKTQFWVQVAAYSNKKGAENARSILDSNKIPADIFTYKDNKDNLFYRVRVGPYTTKSEAEYWRTRIVKIDYFEKAESYVTSTTN